MAKPIPTSGILIIVNGKVLLVRHTYKSNHQGGVYGIPAGKVKKDESDLDTAIRKLNEETGLRAYKNAIFKLPKKYQAEILGREGLNFFSIVSFICLRFTGKLTASKGEIPEWIPIVDIDRLDLLPNVRKIINDGIIFLQNKP